MPELTSGEIETEDSSTILQLDSKDNVIVSRGDGMLRAIVKVEDNVAPNIFGLDTDADNLNRDIYSRQ